MTIRLYLDEDSSDSDLVQALRLRGIDVVVAAECGMRGQPDESQLDWATAQQRVIYTCNRGDFFRLHSAVLRVGGSHGGIIFGVQQRYSVGEQLRRLLRLRDKLTAEDMRNRVEFLSAWGSPA